MEISRLTFTKETKDKMEKGLNKRERGRLRFEKLKEAEANGKLQKAKTRMEVAQLAGFSEKQYKTGYSWVMNMLTRKHLIEHISGRFPNGRAEYEYHILLACLLAFVKNVQKLIVVVVKVMNAVSIVPEYSEVGSCCLHRSKSLNGLVGIGISVGVRILGVTPDTLYRCV